MEQLMSHKTVYFERQFCGHVRQHRVCRDRDQKTGYYWM